MKKNKGKIIVISFFMVLLAIIFCIVLFKKQSLSISLSKQYLKIYEQEQVELKATINPDNASNKKIIWVSEDPGVASVTPTGIVIGGTKGETRIIVKTEDGKVSNYCVVEVIEREVESFELNKNEVVLQKGEDEEIMAIIMPEDLEGEKVTWVSSNPDIATVDENGKVHGISNGITQIKATVLGKEASSTIFVGIKANSLKMEKIEQELEIEKTVKLKVNVTPEDAINERIIWESSDSNILEVDEEGNITGKSIGNVEVIARTEYSKLKDICYVSVVKKKFEVKYTELNKTIIVKDGDALGTLPTMEKDEYIFLGWYTEEKAGSKVSESTIVTSNMTLYPHWQIKETFTEGPGQGIYSRTVTYMGKTFKDYKQNRMGAAISAAGCGPVSLLDILSGYNDSITIEQVVKLTGLSTSFNYINVAATALGLGHSQIYVYSSGNPNETAVRNLTNIAIDHLKHGHQLIVLVARAGCDYGICNGMPYDAYSWGNHFIAIIGVKKDNEHVIIFNPQETRLEEGRMEDIIRYYLPGGPQSGFVAYWK